jgi:hypothetical protein
MGNLMHLTYYITRLLFRQEGMCLRLHHKSERDVGQIVETEVKSANCIKNIDTLCKQVYETFAGVARIYSMKRLPKLDTSAAETMYCPV